MKSITQTHIYAYAYRGYPEIPSGYSNHHESSLYIGISASVRLKSNRLTFSAIGQVDSLLIGTELVQNWMEIGSFWKDNEEKGIRGIFNLSTGLFTILIFVIFGVVPL